MDPNARNMVDVETKLESYRSEGEGARSKRASEKTLKLFHDMVTRVPAYSKFLADNRFDPGDVSGPDDIARLPPVSKDNYLKAYDRKELCWDGDLKGGSWTISTTSGSTGEPYYFPRSHVQDAQYALTAEMYLRTNFDIAHKSTLYVVAFPMGAWIGGVFTYEAIRRVATSGHYALSVITPGINKAEVIKAVKNLGHEFDQVIIGSYAPFLKDIIDDGIADGLVWSKYNVKFIFSAEAFSEHFRDYIAEKAGLKNIYTDTLNHYGTVDLGTMAHETPTSIFIRRLALAQPDIYQHIFGQATKLPTLAQYDPEHFYFEEIGGNLYCSAESGLPLVRYDLKDHGGVITFERMVAIFAEFGIDLVSEIVAAGLWSTLWQLPFVYVYERSDFSVSFFAFQIYPEVVRNALYDDGLPAYLTGKFTMMVEFNDQGRQQLMINVELKARVLDDEELKGRVMRAVLGRLLAESSEYKRTYEEYGAEINPVIVFWPYESEQYFRPGVKQKWIKK